MAMACSPKSASEKWSAERILVESWSKPDAVVQEMRMASVFFHEGCSGRSDLLRTRRWMAWLDG
jgi:hypothetical protein